MSNLVCPMLYTRFIYTPNILITYGSILLTTYDLIPRESNLRIRYRISEGKQISISSITFNSITHTFHNLSQPIPNSM